MAKPKDLIGQRFGRLTVISRGDNTKNGGATWVCTCDCGKQMGCRRAAYAYKSE